MKAEITEATGCPHGQIIIRPESDVDRAMLRRFMEADQKVWMPWIHGVTYEVGVTGPRSMNFGWMEKKKVTMKEIPRQFYGSIALLLIFIAGVFGGALWGRGYDGTDIFASGLLVAGVLFGWVATRDSGAKKAPK